MDLSLSIITILLPLFTFFVLGLLGMKMPKKTAGVIGNIVDACHYGSVLWCGVDLFL